MRVAIHQPNYAPWAGYFAKLALADVFVFLDDAQVPRGRSYFSRTRILGARGAEPAQWLTVPTVRSGDVPIRQVRCADEHWPRRHLLTLRARYARTPFFAEVMALLTPIYAEPGELLAPFNARLVAAIADYLGLRPRFLHASELALAPELRSTERLVALTRAVGGTTYVSGAGGARYQDPRLFAEAGLALEVRCYQPLAYEQGDQGERGNPARPFQPGLSVLDLLFRRGRASVERLTYVK